MPTKLDLTNQRFGKLIALREATDEEKEYKNGVFWYCQCDCGNTTIVRTHSLRCGETKSCGCYNKTRVAETQRAKVIDMTGERYGRLTVIKYDINSSPGSTHWICQCDCGNIVSVLRDSLIGSFTQSCGCLRKEVVSKRGKDKSTHYNINELNNRYGKLTVIRRHNELIDDPVPNYGGIWWLCKCECGNELFVSGPSLRSGNTTSCGCNVSRGELLIKKILDNNNISYFSQFKVNLKNNVKYPLRFDFAVSTKDYNFYFIEFDGKQHFESVEYFGGEKYYKYTVNNDKLKNEFCKTNHIPLIRIPYNIIKKLTIDDLLPQKSQYLYHG